MKEEQSICLTEKKKKKKERQEEERRIAHRTDTFSRTRSHTRTGQVEKTVSHGCSSIFQLANFLLRPRGQRFRLDHLRSFAFGQEFLERFALDELQHALPVRGDQIADETYGRADRRVRFVRVLGDRFDELNDERQLSRDQLQFGEGECVA